MRPCRIAVDAPSLNSPLYIGQRGEDVLVVAFVAQAVVEAFDERVLHGLTRRGIVPLDPMIGRSAKNGAGSQFGAIVRYDRCRLASHRHDGL